MLTIDSAKCTRCGLCAEVCPDSVIHEEPGSSAVEVRHPDYCCQCGHCVAICPTKAIDHEALPLEQFEDQDKSDIGPEQMRALLLSRRSIRVYTPESVAREDLEALIEVGVHAGTASNGQTEEFIIIEDRDRLADLEQQVLKVLWNGGLKYLSNPVGTAVVRMMYGRDMTEKLSVYHSIMKTLRDQDKLAGTIFRNAPAVIVVHGARANDQAPANCAIAVRNMEVQATAMGLGTCWVGFLTAAAHMSRTIGVSLDIPKQRNIYGALMVGHPKHQYKRTIPRKPREIRWI